MKTDKEYPATHSMSTAWYIADEEGNVGILYFNENGPVPKETEQTGIEDLMFGHEEDWEKKQTLPIELSEQQIFEMLSDPRLPEDTDFNYFTVVEISKEKESVFLELAKADDVDLINCISKDLGLYQVDFEDAIIEARGKTPKHIRLRSTLKKMLDSNIIIRTYEAKSYWINDEYENGKVVHIKHFDNSPYYIYHQPYWTNFLPVRMNVPKNPVNIDQLPEKLRDRVLKIPVNFEHTESFQPAQWSLCDAYYDDEDLIVVDGYKYILLPLSDGTEAYINIDINPLDFFDYCSEKNKNGCTQCTSACCTCRSEQFTNRPTVMQIISPFTKNDYQMRVKSDVITQHSIIFPFISKIPYHFKDGFWITEDVARKKVSDNLVTEYFLKNYKYLEDMVQIIHPRVIILDIKARQVLSHRYDLSNHKIEIAGEKYPMFFRSEIIYCRKAIEELAMMPYQGREFPHVISKEEASKWKV